MGKKGEPSKRGGGKIREENIVAYMYKNANKTHFFVC